MKQIAGLLVGIILWVITGPAFAQPAKTIAFSGGEGAITGAILGAGTMALKNDDDIDPLRIGVGAGALFGIGSGIYDVATMGRDQQIVEGIFTDGNTSTAIVLTDTFYGGVAGVILGGAIVMINGEKFTEGLRNGVGAGVWTGFGFGLVDAYLVKRNSAYAGTPYTLSPAAPFRAAGVVTINPSNNVSIGTISAQVYNHAIYDYKPEMGLNMLNIKLRL